MIKLNYQIIKIIGFFKKDSYNLYKLRIYNKNNNGILITKQFKIMYYKKRNMCYAFEEAKKSTAKKRQVGAIIFDYTNEEIISTGHNRMAHEISECENEKGESFDYVIHAEEDAIMKMLTSTKYDKYDTSIKELYITYSPCYNCCKLIVQAGIKSVIYSEKHKSNFTEPSVEGGLSPEQFLIACGVKVEQITKESLPKMFEPPVIKASEKSLIIYHNKDNDGLMSCYLLHKYLTKQNHIVICIGYNYETDPDWINVVKDFNNVYFVDITPEYKFFDIILFKELIEEKKLSVHIYDHHKTFYDWFNTNEYKISYDILKKINYHYSPVDSATMIIWKNFYNGILTDANVISIERLFVEFVDRYDTWNFNEFQFVDNVILWSKNEILAFDTSMREYINNIDEYFSIINTAIKTCDYDKILSNGLKIIEHIKYDNEKALSNPQLKVTSGLFMINHNPNYWLEESISKRFNPQIMCFYKFKEDGNIKFSLRSRKRNDMDILASWYGGGGHKQAAGFEVPIEKGLKIINNHKLSQKQ